MRLLIIDPQVDFHDGGSLAVPGADEDAKRLADFINQASPHIEEIGVTLDTHSAYDIGHPAFWQDAGGKAPPPFTTITTAEFEEGKWKPRILSDADQYRFDEAHDYLKAIERRGHQHMVWPVHCLEGSAGAAIVPVIRDALQKWETNQLISPYYFRKGQDPSRESFSAFTTLDNRSTECTEDLWDLFGHYEISEEVIIAGQALSHCVAATCRDLLRSIEGVEEEAKLLTLLVDCTSPVAGFEEEGRKFIREWEAAGCNVQTTAEVLRELQG